VCNILNKSRPTNVPSVDVMTCVDICNKIKTCQGACREDPVSTKVGKLYKTNLFICLK